MASRGLKIIINGSASYVPNTEKQRRFWMDHNAVLNRPPKIRDVESHLATILDATPEEVELYLYPKPKARAPLPLPGVPGLPNLAAENQALKGEIDQLKNMMLQFMANQGGSAVKAEPVVLNEVEIGAPISSEEEEDEELMDIFGPETEKKRGRPKKS